MQLPSFDIEIQLTGCPKSSDISLQNGAKEEIKKVSIIFVMVSNAIHCVQVSILNFKQKKKIIIIKVSILNTRKTKVIIFIHEANKLTNFEF